MREVLQLRGELVKASVLSVGEGCELMPTAPDWADGLPLDADGYECDCYRKD